MILISNNNLRVLQDWVWWRCKCKVASEEGKMDFMGCWCWEGATLQSMDDPAALVLCPWLYGSCSSCVVWDTDGMIFRVGWLSFCRDQGSNFQLGSVFPMSQAFDFMSSLQSSESGIIVPILQMKLGMQRVCFLLSHRTAVLNFFGTSQGPISWKTIFPPIWCVCARGGGKRGQGWFGDDLSTLHLFWLYF